MAKGNPKTGCWLMSFGMLLVMIAVGIIAALTTASLFGG